MKSNKALLQGYENTTLLSYENLTKVFPNTVAYEALPDNAVSGVIKANRYIDGKLFQTYSQQENHVGVIAATRLGKATEYVIPTILSFAHAKIKRSMVVSDPKGELYKLTAATLAKEGYNVKLINFRDYLHSEYWNPLTPIFRLYRDALNVESEVAVVDTEDGPRNSFRGVIYNSQRKLDEAIEQMKKIAMENVANEIDKIALTTIATEDKNDPYWEDSARELLKAILWAMLEDSSPTDERTLITEENFSFSTALTIMDSMKDGTESRFEDDGYFSSRKPDSRAYVLAKNCILDNGHITRKCIISVFNTKMSIYKASAARLITSCNSFDMKELVGNKPIVVFISYRDEIKAHYQVISSFIQNAYAYLIDHVNNDDSGKLEVPFYFILDEFGNFPVIDSFETVISACAGRNIWFILILQSYAQLNNVYGEAVAAIIRDNLNVHVFIGSNNPSTLAEFSKECGEMTRISPKSALNGSKSEIEYYDIETIPLMPKSTLANLKVGEAIVTEANCGYVLLSKLERYYLCKEFSNLPLSSDKDYRCNVNPLDSKYCYVFTEKKRSESRFNFDL